MNVPPYLRYANQGATRNQPLDPRLVGALGFLGDMGITGEVFSGGQPGKGSGGKRVGSVRHDHGGAGDFRFYKDGRQISWANDADRPLFEEIVRRGKAAGITGFGAGDGYMGLGTMHVGFGSPGVWGAGGRGANAPDWLRKAYNGAAGAPTRENASALQSAMADRENVASSTNESTGMAESKPTVHIGLKPERSTALFDAMLAKAMTNGAKSANVGEAISNLSQVWAATRGKSKAEAENASELQKALAASGLDPSFAMAAQLGGDRSSVASAILAQEENRTQAANRAEARADRLDEREYQREQDVLTNARADASLDIQRQNAARSGVPSGYRATATGLEPIPGGPSDPAVKSAQTFRQATPEEAGRYGAEGGQFGPDGRFYPVNRPKGQTINVTNGRDESEFAKKAAGKMVDRFGTIAETQTGAANTVQTIPVMRELLTQAPTGPIAGRLAERFPGFSTAGDAFQATVNQIAPTLRIPGSGAMSDRDMDILMASFPRLRSDPSANTLIMDVFEKKAQLNLQRSDIAARALRGEIEPAEADRQLSAIDQMPLFDDRMRATLTGQQPQQMQQPTEGGVPVGGLVPGSDAGANVVPVRRARNPQTGETLELRNGQWVPAR